MDSKETRKQQEQQQQQQNQQPPGMLTGFFDLNVAALVDPTSPSQAMNQQRSSARDLSLREPQQSLGLDGSPTSSVATQQSSVQVGNEQRVRRGSMLRLLNLVLTHLLNEAEDIAAKVVAFMSQEPRETCIISASGDISFALIQLTNPKGLLKCEGRYIIVAMSGSVLNTENNGTVTRDGSLRVSISGRNGRVFGGIVAGRLVALSPVQVVVGSFVRGNVQNNPEPASATESPQSRSQGPPRSSESSNKNGSKSPLQQS
ncbi:unnamed protein product [Eruca vesicaria subsp. sativa]|uniref:AT-hook motif nuclear-localized protein n=1 Tax=Eruca vesicaria subsp. sativa TaxID=29727 RepID=A0ABC8MB31_ERUVS|nr:unnamed protein product [Eruca vesicaria subsp. sativa]